MGFDIGKSAGSAGGNLSNKMTKDIGGKITGGAQSLVTGALGGAAGAMVGNAGNAILSNEYPTVTFRFAIEIDGLVSALFTEASGLEWEVEVESFHEGGLNFHERHLIKTGKFSKLTLKRGFTASGSEFLLWLKNIFGGVGTKSTGSNDSQIGRRNVDLVIFDQQMTEVGRFSFSNALITKYTGPTFNSTASEVGFEAIEITYDYFVFQPADIKDVMTAEAMNSAGDMASGLIK